MADETRKQKTAEEDKLRCAEFLLRMIQKYGAEIQNEENTVENA